MREQRDGEDKCQMTKQTLYPSECYLMKGTIVRRPLMHLPLYGNVLSLITVDSLWDLEKLGGDVKILNHSKTIHFNMLLS